MKDCTTCKYGYEDERLGIPMCHHPKRLSEDCVDFNMHEEKHLDDKSDKSLEEEIETWIPAHISIGTDETLPLNPSELADVCKEWGKCIARHFAKWQKSQMLKDAVEADAEVCKLTERVWITPIDEKKFHQDVYDNFKAGDKVRIVVLKAEEE